MKTCLLLIGILCILFSSQFETFGARRDSLAKKYSDLAWTLKDRYPDSSLKYARRALKLSIGGSQNQIHAYSLADIGNYYKRKDDFDSALFYYRRSLKIRRKYLDSSDYASGYNIIGLSYKQQGNYDSSEFYFRYGLTVCPENSKEALKSKILDGLAMTLFNKEQYEECQELLNESIRVLELLGDSVSMAKGWQNKAVVYQHIGKSGDAIFYYDKANGIYTAKSNTSGIIDILNNKGSIYLTQGNYQQAKTTLEMAKSLTLETGLSENTISIYNNLGLAYQGLSDYDEARETFLNAMKASEKTNRANRWVETGLNLIRLELLRENARAVIEIYPKLHETIQIESWTKHLPELYKIYSSALGKLGRYEDAFRIASLSSQVLDSINHQVYLAREKADEIERLSKEGQLLKNQLLLQDESTKRLDAESKVYRLTTWTIGISLILVLITFYFIRKNIGLRLVAEMQEKNTLIERSKIEEHISYKIGQDLHDNIGSKLAAVQMSLDNLIPGLGDVAKKVDGQLKRIDSFLDELSEDVRSIAHNLMSRVDDGKDFKIELQRYLKLIEDPKKIKIHFIAKNLSENISERITTETLAIMRLLIGNILKHAEATEVTVQAIGENDYIRVSVEDNGKGFNPDDIIDSRGRGLKNFTDRANRLSAIYQLDTSPGKGTSISLQIPLKSKK